MTTIFLFEYKYFFKPFSFSVATLYQFMVNFIVYGSLVNVESLCSMGFSILICHFHGCNFGIIWNNFNNWNLDYFRIFSRSLLTISFFFFFFFDHFSCLYSLIIFCLQADCPCHSNLMQNLAFNNKTIDHVKASSFKSTSNEYYSTIFLVMILWNRPFRRVEKKKWKFFHQSFFVFEEIEFENLSSIN